MASMIIFASASLAVAFVLYASQSFYRNFARAKASGFACVILPTHLMSVSWLLASTLFLPLLERLPENIRGQWIPLLLLDRIWGFGHRPFALAGSDTIMAVSPFQTTLFTCEPQLVTQLLRNPSFGKPTKLLGLLNVFGPSLTGTDGAENKLLRKVAAPFFHTRTMNVVVKETVEATEAFLDLAEARSPPSPPIDEQLRPILAKMALHILGKTAFEKEGSCREELEFTERPPQGHELSFAETFLGIDQHLPLVALTPLPILRYSPLRIHKRAHTLHKEMSLYLKEAVDSKDGSLRSKTAESKSLLDIFTDAGKEGVFSPTQVSGNIFIVNFAGHDSNAQGIHFALLQLASRPKLQQHLQNDIDRIFGDTPPEQWSYDKHFTALAGGMVAAVINESLRVYTVLPILIKHTTATPVAVTIAGEKHIVPANTLIFINTSATHRNPRFWPTSKSAVSDEKSGITSEFNPYQWLTSDEGGKFLNPEPGSFVPFSDGGRGCLGQRFATVELYFTIARMLKHHSVELAVDTTPTDSIEDTQRKWTSARDNAQYQLSGGVIYNMTLRTGRVPVRFVKRGRESSHVIL